MNKSKIVFSTIVFIIGFGSSILVSSMISTAKADTPVQCPTNSYRIGGTDTDPVCKQNPTGCPYSENTPIDSPKCAPPPQEVVAQPQPQPANPITTEVPAVKPAPPKVNNSCKE